jgi:putative transposase
MSTPHGKQVRSYNIAGHAHCLTFSCFRRLPLLSRDRTRRWFVDAMESARRQRRLQLWAYVIMPEHVHVLFWPLDAEYKVSLIRTAFKTPVTRKALPYLRQHAPAFLEHLKDGKKKGTFYFFPGKAKNEGGKEKHADQLLLALSGR